MNSKLFGSLVAGMLITSPSFANDAKKTDAKADAHHCVSNACAGQVKMKDGTAAKNTCKGQVVKDVDKEHCEKDGHGTWTKEEAKAKK